jgi:hypothetical protein
MASSTAIFNSLRFVKGSRRHPVSAAHLLHVGILLCINTTTGMAVAGASGAGLRCVGRCGGTVDNSAGAAGDLYVVAVQEPASFENSATAPLGIGDIGLPVYIEDDRTVAKTIASNAVEAGILIGFDGDKCIVDQSNL